MSIASEISRLQNDSAAIASAIAAKGVAVPSGSGYDDYASLIAQISAGGGGSLPYDAEIEYLEATGTQNINTGIYVTYGSTKVIVDCKYVSDYSTTQILVGYGAAYGKYFGNLNSYYGVGSANSQKLTVTSSTRAVIFISYTSNSRVDIYANVSSGTAAPSGLIADYPLNLFCGSNNYYSKARIYSCKIYNGQSLIADFIPVRISTVGYMYDRISKTLFANAGSGSFVLGNDL